MKGALQIEALKKGRMQALVLIALLLAGIAIMGMGAWLTFADVSKIWGIPILTIGIIVFIIGVINFIHKIFF